MGNSTNLVWQSLFAAAAVSLLTMQVTFAQADPFIGTWKLNPAKSIYSGEEPWQSGTMSIVASGEGFILTNDFIRADGSPGPHEVGSFKYDGQPHTLVGNPTFDSGIVRKVDAATLEITLLNSREPRPPGRIVVVFSPDGRTATWTVNATTARRTLSRTQVYEKQ